MILSFICSASVGSIVVRDFHIYRRRRWFASAPALQTLELIDGPVHVALDCGLVALEAFEFEAFWNTQPLPVDLKLCSFLLMKFSLLAIQMLECLLQQFARNYLRERNCLRVKFTLVCSGRRLAV